MPPRRLASTILWVLPLAAALLAATTSATHAQDQARPNRILIEYVPPKDPAHQMIYDGLKQHRALEMVQTLFSPLKLTVDLTIKVTGCDGIDNAWYQNHVLTICYEYVDKDINANVPKETTADGIAPIDAMVGQFL